MRIKNVVILLQKVLPFFPREKGQGAQVEGLIKNAITQEKREDLKLLLQSCVAGSSFCCLQAPDADPDCTAAAADTRRSSASSSRSGSRKTSSRL